MRSETLRDTAQQMIQLHGLRAPAMALERVAQMRASGDTAEHERWQAVHALICEFRRTGRRSETPDAGRSTNHGSPWA
jgi:hypothetical protein